MSLLFSTPRNVPSNSLPHHTCEIPDTKRLNSFLLEPAKGYVLQKKGHQEPGMWWSPSESANQ